MLDSVNMNLPKYGLKARFKAGLKHLKKDRQLMLIFLPCIIFYAVFRYIPIYGIIIAFKKFNFHLGIMNSPWVGLKYFRQFFGSADFLMLLENTLKLGVFSLLWTFPFPIVFAILLNEIRFAKLRKTVQTVSYLPSFLSVTIVCSMVIDFLSPSSGLVNNILSSMGFERTYFMVKPEYFRTIYITSEIWSTMGYSSIVYLAALSGINPELYEAGRVDGCSRFQTMFHITVPGIFPTIATMFILKSGGFIRVGFEKVLLLYNPATYSVADVFSTYVYRKGILESSYSYAAAVGLFEGIIAFIVLFASNQLSKKLTEQSLW